VHDRPPGRPGDRPGRDRAHLLHHRDRLRVVEQAAVVKVVDGRLPPGTKLFDFAGSSGLINGVPTTAGSFTFTVQVKAETRLLWHLFAGGGVQPSTWSVVAGALPPGLELPRRENTISGTPTTAGTFTFTVRVTDDLGAFSDKELSITIS
jgi:hypothetical protein